ncbi:MAG: DedA family protein [bacterium]|nr:DedA family protein [bacterium]
MENLLNFLQLNFPILFEHKYIFLFLGAMIEGLNTMVLGGFLVSTGSIPLLPTFMVFTLGYTVNGYLWYLVGYFGGSTSIDKWGRKKPKSEKIINTVQHYFERHSGKAIVITKFTFSLTIAALIMAGSLKYNLKRFTLYNFIGSVGWVAMTLFIGYFFGQSYKFFIVYLKNFTYFLIFLGGAITLIYLLKLVIRSAFIRSLFMHERVKYLSEKIKNGLDRILNNDK